MGSFWLHVLLSSANSGLGSLARARARATHPSTCRSGTMCFGPACLGHLACVPAVCGPAGPGPGRPGLGPGPASPGPAVHQQCAGHAGRGLAGLCLGRADLGLGCPRSVTVWHLTGSGQLAQTRAQASHLWGPANNVPGLPFAHCCLGSLARARSCHNSELCIGRVQHWHQTLFLNIASHYHPMHCTQ